MCYVHTTIDHVMVGWIGDEPKDLTAHLDCDADFAGCPYTLKSTNGLHPEIAGPNSRFPWAPASKQQTARAQSTPEAELNSLKFGKKNVGEPALDIIQRLFVQYHSTDWQALINIHEDNTTAITAS